MNSINLTKDAAIDSVFLLSKEAKEIKSILEISKQFASQETVDHYTKLLSNIESTIKFLSSIPVEGI